MSAQPLPAIDTAYTPAPSIALVHPPIDDEYIEDAEDDVLESSFHCGSEYHLGLIGSEVASRIYVHGLRLSRKSGVYCPAIPSLAKFMSRSEDATRKGLQALVKVGMFKVKRQGVCTPTAYTVLTHKEWAEENPGQCVQKAEYHWTGEGDKVGQYIWAQTSQQVKPLEFQMKNIRKLLPIDDEIIARFDEYYTSRGQYKKPKNVVVGFYEWLKTRC